MLNKQLITRWVVYLTLIIYALINLDAWLRLLLPSFYEGYFSKIGIYDLYNKIGIWVLLFVLLLIVLRLTKLLKMTRGIFWIMVIIFLGNLLLMYLEVLRHGDT